MENLRLGQAGGPGGGKRTAAWTHSRNRHACDGKKLSRASGNLLSVHHRTCMYHYHTSIGPPDDTQRKREIKTQQRTLTTACLPAAHSNRTKSTARGQQHATAVGTCVTRDGTRTKTNAPWPKEWRPRSSCRESWARRSSFPFPGVLRPPWPAPAPRRLVAAAVRETGLPAATSRRERSSGRTRRTGWDKGHDVIFLGVG